MNWLIYHIASGHSFFSGVALILLGVWLSNRSAKMAKRLTVLAVLIGGLAIAISATPLPIWMYAVASSLTLVWLVGSSMGFPRAKSRSWRVIVTGIWAAAVGVELPYHFIRTPRPIASRSITVIGDSITAGMGSSDRTIRWPTLLLEEHNLNIQDLSRSGETVASANERLGSEPITSPFVFLEIGGNDLLGDTSNAQYEKDLDALLKEICISERQVMMLELPLLPFRNEFGRIQRKLAANYRVILVPKRVLLSIVTADDSTVDGIHLTQSGHRRMAEVVWGLIRPAFKNEPAQSF